MSHGVCPGRVPQMSQCAQQESTDVPQCVPRESPQMSHSAQMGSSTLCCSLFDMCSPVFLNRSLSIFLSVLAYMFTLRALFLSIAIFPHIPRQHLYLKWYQRGRGLPIDIVEGRMESMPVQDSVSL